jgi:hypothetical protein
VSKLIGLTGHMQAGKDSIGKILVEEHGFQRFAFADQLKSMALALNPLVPCEEWVFQSKYVGLAAYVREWGWERAKGNPEVRRFLQVLGTEGVREHIGEDAWVQALETKLDAAGWEVFEGQHEDFDVVVTDARFPNEADWVHELGGQVWRVVRPGHAGDGHASEALVDGLPADFEIANDGTLEQLAVRVGKLLGVALVPPEGDV